MLVQHALLAPIAVLIVVHYRELAPLLLPDALSLRLEQLGLALCTSPSQPLGRVLVARVAATVATLGLDHLLEHYMCF